MNIKKTLNLIWGKYFFSKYQKSAVFGKNTKKYEKYFFKCIKNSIKFLFPKFAIYGKLEMNFRREFQEFLQKNESV